jgi:hypothetical protein
MLPDQNRTARVSSGFRNGIVLGLVIAVLGIVAGCAGATQGSPSASAPGASASPSGGFGGTVQFQMDGAPATTTVDLVLDGATVSGTAVSELRKGTHTVRLECAAQDGDTWALGGTTEQTTVPGERADAWSAVIVKDGSPQQIGIWLSDDKSEGVDCNGWLAGIDFATIGLENFHPVESGTLVPPPDLAP